jgi:hypothetical protein
MGLSEEAVSSLLEDVLSSPPEKAISLPPGRAMSSPERAGITAAKGLLDLPGGQFCKPLTRVANDT